MVLNTLFCLFCCLLANFFVSIPAYLEHFNPTYYYTVLLGVMKEAVVVAAALGNPKSLFRTPNTLYQTDADEFNRYVVCSALSCGMCVSSVCILCGYVYVCMYVFMYVCICVYMRMWFWYWWMCVINKL